MIYFIWVTGTIVLWELIIRSKLIVSVDSLKRSLVKANLRLKKAWKSLISEEV